MTPRQYNECFRRVHDKALSFVSCLDHALQKSDANARMQLDCIGWDEETKNFLLDAIQKMNESARESYRWDGKKWWKEIE